MTVRDGCGAGGDGHVGVFASGAAGHPFTLIVLDTVTHELRSYRSGAGTPFALVSDPAAFGCP